MRVGVEADPRACRIDAILPVSADPDYEYVICQKIIDFNYKKRFGSLQYDKIRGELSYRFSFPTTCGLFMDDLKMLFLTAALSVAEGYEEIKKSCVGKFSSKETTEILGSISRLVDDLRNDEG